MVILNPPHLAWTLGWAIDGVGKWVGILKDTLILSQSKSNLIFSPPLDNFAFYNSRDII